MDPARAIDPIRPRLVVRWTALVVGSALLVADFVITWPESRAPYRAASLLIILALAAFELIGGKRTEVIVVGPAVVFAVLSLVS